MPDMPASLRKKKTPNRESVSQLLDLEFSARRAFIDSFCEEDRHKKIPEDIGHVMEELQRILDKNNIHYIDELKGRWDDFCQKVQFFGVWKKLLKPSVGMDKGSQYPTCAAFIVPLFICSSEEVRTCE
ncbi:uncharacterized protein LOC120819857 [Gasterosteus aculeatus]